MKKYKLFLSHSSEDIEVVDAFMDFMYKIGLTEENIICTSVASTKIPIGEDIYEYLTDTLSGDDIYVIYFLSDNYYSSPVCLNEMGAAWIKKFDSLSLLLAGFDFNDIQGVISKNKIGVKLGSCDSMTKAAFNEFKTVLERLFNLSIPPTRWEISRDEFLSKSIENVRKFNMSFSRSFCIDDLENDGCKIVRKDSSNNMLKATINFNETDSKLSSIVIFNGKRDFTSHFINKKSLCFEAYADEGINCVDVELRLTDLDMPYEIYLDNDEKSFRIPLVLFCDSLMPWKNVPEIKFVFHRRKVANPSTITIKNLRIE